MRKRIAIAILLSAVMVFGVVGIVHAYISFKTDGPDVWLDPGYRWNVNSDTTTGQAVCIQWSTDGGSTWDRAECTWASAPDNWTCEIPSNFANVTVRYEFYKDNDADDCSVGTGESEWTGQYTFNTGPNAITLADLTARATSPALLVGSVLLLGAVIVWRRKRA
mgnify:CR=1 FL=1